MLTLRSSPASPFGRKVKIAATLLGLSDRITVVAADTNDPSDDLRRHNPLGKIPTLILEDGEALFDSRVIVAYLDELAGGGRLVPAGEGRIAALKHEAMADGLLDAALLQVYEDRYRPAAMRVQSWVDHQAGKVTRTLDLWESTSAPVADPLHIGHVAQACALGYLDLRFRGEWRETYPKLVAWLDGFSGKVPAFAETIFKP